MVVANKEKEDLRVRLRPGLKEKLDGVIEARKTSQQKLVNELVAWFVEQSAMLQTILLGQVEDRYRAQVARMILEEIAEYKPSKGADPIRPKEPPAGIPSTPPKARR